MRCRLSLTAALASVVVAGCGHRSGAGETTPEPSASGQLRNATGEAVGVVAFTERPGGLTLSVSVGGLTPGLHGMHLHETGACSAPDFRSAGGHFNPEGRRHGRRNPDGPHAGDLPNLRVGDDGSADTAFIVDRAFIGTGARSLFHPGGTALVLHAGPDDERTDPSGGSGERVACAVLEPG